MNAGISAQGVAGASWRHALMLMLSMRQGNRKDLLGEGRYSLGTNHGAPLFAPLVRFPKSLDPHAVETWCPEDSLCSGGGVEGLGFGCGGGE